MQRLWQVNTSWDAALLSDIEKDWIDSRRKMIDLNILAINMSIVGDGEIADIQLEGFSDSSATAYGAFLYLRLVNINGKCTTNLICSKSRVAPLKTVSIPRLELLVVVLGTSALSVQICTMLTTAYKKNILLVRFDGRFSMDSVTIFQVENICS